MSTKMLALIVVYGSNPQDTPSMRSLLMCHSDECQLRIIVWDNSPKPQDVDWKEIGKSVTYISSPDNLSLSTIYNRVVSKHLCPEEFILLLDQDSHLPEDFLEKAVASIAAHPDIDLFLPMLHANGRWVSPNFYLCGWGLQWRTQTVGPISSNQVCAINSGMIISSSYMFESYPVYDERLRFYGTDTQFMLDYMDRRPRLFVIDSVILHDLSFFSVSVSKRFEKFSVMRASLDLIYERRPHIQRIAVKFVMFLVSIRYALLYRDLNFICGGNQ